MHRHSYNGDSLINTDTAVTETVSVVVVSKYIRLSLQQRQSYVLRHDIQQFYINRHSYNRDSLIYTDTTITETVLGTQTQLTLRQRYNNLLDSLRNGY